MHSNVACGCRMGNSVNTQMQTSWRYWGIRRFDSANLLLILIPLTLTAIAYLNPVFLLATCGTLPGFANGISDDLIANTDALALRYLWAAAFTLEIAACLSVLTLVGWLIATSLGRHVRLPVVGAFIVVSIISVAISAQGGRAYQCVGTSSLDPEMNLFQETLGKIVIHEASENETSPQKDLPPVPRAESAEASDTPREEPRTVLTHVSWQIGFASALATTTAVAIGVAAVVLTWRISRLSYFQKRRRRKKVDDLLSKFVRRYQILFVAAAALVTMTVFNMASWTRMPAPYLQGELGSTYQAVADHHILYGAFTFSVVLAGIFLPTGLFLVKHLPGNIASRVPLMNSPAVIRSFSNAGSFREKAEAGAKRAASSAIDITTILAPILAAIWSNFDASVFGGS